MKVDVRWTGKRGFLGISGSGHAVVMDTSEANGGEGSAASPMEMVLMGLAGCSGIDVVSILEKKRVALEGLQVLINSERADEHPKVFTKVNLTFVFKGKDLNHKALEDSVRLSIDRYCSVAGMVNKTAEINWEIVVED